MDARKCRGAMRWREDGFGEPLSPVACRSDASHGLVCQQAPAFAGRSFRSSIGRQADFDYGCQVRRTPIDPSPHACAPLRQRTSPAGGNHLSHASRAAPSRGAAIVAAIAGTARFTMRSAPAATALRGTTRAESTRRSTDRIPAAANGSASSRRSCKSGNTAWAEPRGRMTPAPRPTHPAQPRGDVAMSGEMEMGISVKELAGGGS
jgi:hypothetical protein